MFGRTSDDTHTHKYTLKFDISKAQETCKIKTTSTKGRNSMPPQAKIPPTIIIDC